MRSGTLGGGIAVLVVGIILFLVGSELAASANEQILENPFDPNKWDAADDQKTFGNLLESLGMILVVVGVIVAVIGAVLPKSSDTRPLLVGSPQTVVFPSQLECFDNHTISRTRHAPDREYCSSCGRALLTGSAFCAYCGKSQQ